MTNPKDLTIIILVHLNDWRLKKAIQSANFGPNILLIQTTDGLNLDKYKKECKILKYEQEINDFSELRNWSIKQSKSEWIFFLDSDEVISKDSHKDIINFISSSPYEAALVRRVDVFHNKALKQGEVGETNIIRLFKASRVKYLRPVHEVASVNGVVEQSNIIIKHYSHNNVADFLDDIDHYAQIEAKYRIKENPLLSKKKILLQLFFFPSGKFFYNYLIKLGFLDGWRGFIYASMMSLHSMFVRIYCYQKIAFQIDPL